MKMDVEYVDYATFVIQVEIPDDTPEDERKDAAIDAAEADNPSPYRGQAPGGLCHRCSSIYDLSGAPEPGEVWETEA